MRTRLVCGVLAATTAALVAAGCSEYSSAPPAGGDATTAAATSPSTAVPVSSQHNDADVAFATDMLPHHRQAVEMSSLARTRAAALQVKELATRIDQEQGPEIEQMNQMLDAWGAPRPPSGSGSMAGMSGMSMPGMMGETQMQQLAAQSGAAFDRMFLQMMIEHHSGAITMARTEQALGLNPQATELAGAIVTAQQSEITQMQTLLPRV